MSNMLQRVVGAIRGDQLPAATTGDAHGGVSRYAEFMRGNRGVVFGNWRPTLRSSQEDVANAWDNAAARVVDAVHNSGWLSGAVDQAVANTVGEGLRLKAMPRAEALGITEDEARKLAREIERRFEVWAGNKQECDIQGLRTFGQMQETSFRSWLAMGEVLSESVWRRRRWNTYGTKVRLLSPHRLCRDTEPMKRLISGVYTDPDGMPVAYRAERKHPLLGTVKYDVPARDSAGRPKVNHIFTGLPEQYRGISPMTPALQVARQFDQLSDATLTASIVQALFAVTVSGDAPTEEVLSGLLTPQEQAMLASTGTSPLEAWLAASAGYYDNSTINVGINGRVSHLFPGQEMNFHSAQHPGGDYKEYSRDLKREIARCLGMTYESATGDYEGATYSSVRMGTSEVFKVTLARRSFVVAPFCQAHYDAWLEEEIERHGLEFPGGIEGFRANRSAACRAKWSGSPKPQADDLKTAKSHETWKRLGVMSDEMICNDLGVDVEDVYDQRAREKALRAEKGIEEPTYMNAKASKEVDGLLDEGPKSKEGEDGDDD